MGTGPSTRRRPVGPPGGSKGSGRSDAPPASAARGRAVASAARLRPFSRCGGCATCFRLQELARVSKQAEQARAQLQQALAAAEARARDEAAKWEERLREAGAAHDAATEKLQASLLQAQAEQVKIQGEGATRRAAADALGERVVLLQEQVASAQLDLEQARHAAIADKAQLESELRERQEDLEAARVDALAATHEAERLKAQLTDKTAALQKLHAVYERTVQETRRVEDEAQAERHALHAERRQLELRLQEEQRRAQKAAEQLEKLKREGLLGRLFNGGEEGPDAKGRPRGTTPRLHPALRDAPHGAATEPPRRTEGPHARAAIT